jgi:glycosyltransferase involved in cell wall biosynthesis
MKKIILITPFPDHKNIHTNNTGVASYSYFLVSELKKNINVEVWAQKGNDLEDLEEENLSVKRVWSKDFSGIFSILKKVWKERPEMIHIQQELSMFDSVFTFPFSILIFILPRILGTKVITTMHGGFGIKQIDKTFVQENGYSLPPLIIKIAFYFTFGVIAHVSNKVIVHEDWQKEELRDDYKVSKNKIYVIPHGVPEDVEILDKSILKKEMSLEKYDKVFLYMGFAAKYKGLPELFKIYKEYLKNNPKTLLVVGAGPAARLKNDTNYMTWYEGLQMMYESLGGNVSWLGFIKSEEIPKYYSVCDAVLFPYSRRMAASGPLAIAIGFEKDVALSNVFKNGITDEEFKFDFEDVLKTGEMKKERVWSVVAGETLAIYKK